MTKPAIVKKTSGAPITLLDLGLYAYVTGGAEKENPTFISSVGITAGLNNVFSLLLLALLLFLAQINIITIGE